MQDRVPVTTSRLSGLPGQSLNGVLITHFHSDHIAAIPNINLGSWVAGREGPLKVYGPPGVARVVAGFNEAFAQDREYRTAHHGQDFMPIEYGLLEAVERSVESTLEFGDLTITSFAVDHSPIEPAVGYRFDYKGRSVVITGDTIVTDRLRNMIDDADLLFSDALSLPIVQTLQAAAEASGQSRLVKVLVDIQDYHASVADVAELTRSTGVGMIALYHLVPGPRNALMENIFEREMTDNMVLTRDRMWFSLPAGSDVIEVR
ncbi:MAG: MBL fold metallo-hydrolase [Gammaproteobacteria bacterium]|nr:MBL fold metallo-hydrolase [Gammaproteobacteria bacterium]